MNYNLFKIATVLFAGGVLVADEVGIPAAVTVTKDRAPIMKGTEIVETVRKGAVLKVIAEKGDWYGVGGVDGWIQKQHVQIGGEVAHGGDAARRDVKRIEARDGEPRIAREDGKRRSIEDGKRVSAEEREGGKRRKGERDVEEASREGRKDGDRPAEGGARDGDRPAGNKENSKVARIYRFYDKSGDGSVTFSEWLQTKNYELNDDQKARERKWFNRADRNANGGVSADEFKWWMEVGKRMPEGDSRGPRDTGKPGAERDK